MRNTRNIFLSRGKIGCRKGKYGRKRLKVIKMFLKTGNKNRSFQVRLFVLLAHISEKSLASVYFMACSCSTLIVIDLFSQVYAFSILSVGIKVVKAPEILKLDESS